MPTSTSTYLTLGRNWLRTTRKNPCPICQRAGYCEISKDNKTVHCMKVASPRVFAHRQGGWLHSHPLYFDYDRATSSTKSSPSPTSASNNRRVSFISKDSTTPANPKAKNQKLGEMSPQLSGSQPYQHALNEHATSKQSSSMLPTSLPFRLGEVATSMLPNSLPFRLGEVATSTPAPVPVPVPEKIEPAAATWKLSRAEARLLARVINKAIAISNLTSSSQAPAGEHVASEPELEQTGQPQRASLDTLHAVYTDYLAACPLDPAHAKAIAAKRKLTPAQIEAMGIKSIPHGKAREQILATLVAKWGLATMLTVPGFILATSQTSHALAATPPAGEHVTANATSAAITNQATQGELAIASGKTYGVYLPATALGRIRGLVVARHNKPTTWQQNYPNSKAKVKVKEGPKYWWFSSVSEGGPEALASLSLYMPLALNKLTIQALALSDAPENEPEQGVEQEHATTNQATSMPASPLNQINLNQILITEGQYKAFIAAQYLGCPAIAVPGVSSWETTGVVELVQELVAISANPKSVVVTVAYDSEVNPNTDRAKLALCEALVSAGLKVALATWDNPDGQLKGIDDLALAGLLPMLRRYRYLPGLTGLPIDRFLDEDKLDENLSPASDKKATLIRSPRGTGKTHWLTRLAGRYIQKDYQLLIIGHRVSLLSEAARRHGMDFYGRYKQPWEDAGSSKNNSKDKNKNNSPTTAAVPELGIPDGLAITFDSLDMIRPENLKERLVVVIDESEQGLMHLAGSTIKDKRQRILAKLNMLLVRADKIIFLDADLGTLSYNFLTAGDFTRNPLVAAGEVELIVNEARPAPKTYVRYSDKMALIQRLIEELEAGHRCFIATNGRKTTKYLYKLLTRRFPQLKGWLLNAHTSGEPGERAKIDNINQTIKSYDYTIASPTLGTGVSIDYTGIDTVFLFGEPGVNTHNDLLQQAARVRNPATGQIHAWISPKKRPDLSCDVATIKKRLMATPLETASLLGRRAEVQRRLYGAPLEQQYFDLLAHIEADRNLSWQDLAGNFWRAVEREGHTLLDAGDLALPDSSFKEVKAEYKAAREEVRGEGVQSVLDAPDIEEAEYKKLSLKSYQTDTERAASTKYSLQRFYGLTVDRELIRRDNEGRMRAKITNFLAASNLEYAAEQDWRDMGEPQVTALAGANPQQAWETRPGAGAGAGAAAPVSGKGSDSDRINSMGNELHQPTPLVLRDPKLLGDWRNLYPKTLVRLDFLTACGFIDPQTGKVDFTPKFTEESLRAAGLTKWLNSAAKAGGETNRQRLARLLGIQNTEGASGLTRTVTSVLAQLGLECDVRQFRTGETYLDPLTGKLKAVRRREYTVSGVNYQEVRELALARRTVLEAREKERLAGLTPDQDKSESQSAGESEEADQQKPGV